MNRSLCHIRGVFSRPWRMLFQTGDSFSCTCMEMDGEYSKTAMGVHEDHGSM